MKIALIDASSIILLFKAGLFEPVSKAYVLKATPAVINEITVENHRGASDFSRAFASGALRAAHPGASMPAHRLAPLGAGERETIMAFNNAQGDFLIIDDGKGASVCRSSGIPYINALLIPKLLHWSGIIDRSKRRTSFKVLVHVGRYSNQVIDYANTCTADMLMAFLPSRHLNTATTADTNPF